MNKIEILDIISKGESSKVQFKENIHNEQSIAQEMIAFANTDGGIILIGINDKTWEVSGITREDIQRLNNLLVNAAEQHIKPAIYISTEVVDIDSKNVMVVQVPKGVAIPYKDKDGIIWVKNGANKRKVTSNEEIARLLQSSGYLYAEEKIIEQSTIEDLNIDKLKTFYWEQYNEEFEKDYVNNVLENLRLGKNGKLNVAGALLFGKNLKKILPQFYITAIWFWGNELEDTAYRSSENIYGTLDELYKKGFDFIVSKLNRIQPKDRGFNSLGELEIPETVFTEILVNALIHRDYFINDSIKIFVFENRIEIISPGSLPNNLTPEQVKRGIRRTRNNIIASFAPSLMEYRGAGSGILRALKVYPQFEIINERADERVIVKIYRQKSILN
ncbi:MAG TPA: putative DNA binding domain-containing protein [Treponema sp.]|jgi:ATP-dependent DNA helicase RecG|nr:putative DNA binding domain-containing protein [Treponema sp.]HPC72336.1 putative DNA binding domain-containing protein [Treponema sp.]HRS03675.1 putative DNA binding domain-containing protein [Treponema sp.]HRU29493.1 putative DNA binding domain-containing protein [Treponema sp.]